MVNVVKITNSLIHTSGNINISGQTRDDSSYNISQPTNL